MQAFVINLPRAGERWERMQGVFAHTALNLRRVPAVDGEALDFPQPGYAESAFRWFHGRETNPREVGCYFSHVRAMQAFLETGDEHGLICEDDLSPDAHFAPVLESALRYSRHWNVLRVSALGRGVPVRMASLGGAYELCVNFGRMKGAGAYVIDRAAARAFVARLLPMSLPFDHAMDREWAYGLRAACILPFPCSQTSAGFDSSIQKGRTQKLPSAARWYSTYPYQAANESARWLFRGGHWLRARFSMARRGVHAAPLA